MANFPGAGAYASSMTIKFVQDGTGSRTMTWPGTFKFPSGSSNALSTAAGSVDIITIYTTTMMALHTIAIYRRVTHSGRIYTTRS